MPGDNLNILCDSRFNYKTDNPFVGPNKTEYLNRLKTYILQNINDFKDVDWISDSRSFNIPINSAFDEKIEKKLEDNHQLCYYTSNFLNNISH